MISVVEIIIKILMVAIAALVLWKLCRAGSTKQKLCVLAVCVILGIAAQMACTTMTPTLTETVSVEALNEMNPASGSNEILIKRFVVDGKEIDLPQPIEGKWFWCGSNYNWRSEWDSRQPDGVTREVVFEIPVGMAREIVFTCSEWNGKAVVTCLGTTTEVDTYRSETTTVPIPLPESASGKLIGQSGLRILIFAAALLVMSCVIYVIYRVWNKNPGNSRNWLRRNWVYFGCGAIAVFAFLYMRSISGLESFWNDEIWQIEFALRGTSVWEDLLLLHSTYYGSWAEDILTLWYRIVPWGVQYLLIPTQIATTAGIFFIGLTGKVLRNERTAITAAGVAAVSTNLILQSGFEFRSYGFVFLGCALALWQYCRMRCAGKLTWSNLILFGVFMWMPAGCHVFGVFFCVPFFFADLFLYFKKQLPIKAIWSYVITVVLYLPWLYNMICCKATSVEATWMGVPSLSALKSLLQFLTASNQTLYLLFWIGLCAAIFGLFASRASLTPTAVCEMVTAVIPCFVVGFVFVYGKYINTTATMWMERYFVCLFPCVVVLIALALDSILALLKDKRMVSACICAAIVLSVGLQTLPAMKSQVAGGYPGYQSFQKAADWFYTKKDYCYNDSTLIIYAPDAPYRAWQEYCLTKQGVRDPLQVVSQYDLQADDLEGMRVVYVYYEHIGFFDWTKYLLKEAGLQQSANDTSLKIATYVKQ